MDAVLALSPGTIVLRLIVLSLYLAGPIVFGVWAAGRLAAGGPHPLVAAGIALASMLTFSVLGQLVAPTEASQTEEGEWGGWVFVLLVGTIVGACQAVVAAFVAAAIARRHRDAPAAG